MSSSASYSTTDFACDIEYWKVTLCPSVIGQIFRLSEIYSKKNENIINFLKYIKDNSEYDYILDRDIYGNVDINITNEDITYCLDSFLKKNGLAKVSSNKNTYIIPNDKKTEYRYKIEFEDAK